MVKRKRRFLENILLMHDMTPYPIMTKFDIFRCFLINYTEFLKEKEIDTLGYRILQLGLSDTDASMFSTFNT